MELADDLLRRAKRSRGLIDSHLKQSYGPGVESLYYYLVNMKRLAVRLGELGLRRAVLDIGERVDRAVSEFTDEQRRPIVDEPGVLLRAAGPIALKLTRARLRGPAVS
jgi:hypothetical protein